MPVCQLLNTNRDVKKIGPRLREITPAARGSQDAGSCNLPRPLFHVCIAKNGRGCAGRAGKNTADICNAFAEWVPSFQLHCLAPDAAAGCVALVRVPPPFLGASIYDVHKILGFFYPLPFVRKIYNPYIKNRVLEGR